MVLKALYLTFSSPKSFENFFRRKLNPIRENEIEYCVMEKFKSNRILFTAEHANSKKFKVKKFGPKAFVTIGDTNTGILAKIGAFHMLSAYIFPLFNRKDADAARNPKELGKGLVLFTRITNSETPQKVAYVPIHSDSSYLKILERYHSIIEKLNPRAIISVHGLHADREFDMLFGFGPNYEMIGGKKEAFKFKKFYIQKLSQIFEKLNLNFDMRIGVSTWRWMGSKNYVLTRHIAEYNKSGKKKRIGLQVEMNYKGRVCKETKGLPSKEYQIAIQVLGEVVWEWLSLRR